MFNEFIKRPSYSTARGVNLVRGPCKSRRRPIRYYPYSYMVLTRIILYLERYTLKTERFFKEKAMIVADILYHILNSLLRFKDYRFYCVKRCFLFNFIPCALQPKCDTEHCLID